MIQPLTGNLTKGRQHRNGSKVIVEHTIISQIWQHQLVLFRSLRSPLCYQAVCGGENKDPWHHVRSSIIKRKAAKLSGGRWFWEEKTRLLHSCFWCKLDRLPHRLINLNKKKFIQKPHALHWKQTLFTSKCLVYISRKWFKVSSDSRSTAVDGHVGCSWLPT